MNKIGKQYLLILFILVIITCLTLSIFYKTFPLVKETFLPSGNHNCYPYTSIHKPSNSYNTKSKGWCSTKDYGYSNDDDYDSSSYGNSPVKCQSNYSRVNAAESYKTNTKAYCRKPNV